MTTTPKQKVVCSMTGPVNNHQFHHKLEKSMSLLQAYNQGKIPCNSVLHTSSIVTLSALLFWGYFGSGIYPPDFAGQEISVE